VPEQAHREYGGRGILHRCLDVIAIAAALVLTPAIGLAQDAWPAKPVRIIVPFPASGAVDPLVRGLSNGLTARLGQPVLVESRPGATGTIGMAACARSPPDGYTPCFVTGSVNTDPNTIEEHFFRGRFRSAGPKPLVQPKSNLAFSRR
jgi:tripartite-type tricarboxylate transporter receptor subunit TctC